MGIDFLKNEIGMHKPHRKIVGFLNFLMINYIRIALKVWK